jgi:hypothetical protein
MWSVFKFFAQQTLHKRNFSKMKIRRSKRSHIFSIFFLLHQNLALKDLHTMLYALVGLIMHALVQNVKRG